MPIKYNNINDIGLDPISNGKETPMFEELDDRKRNDNLDNVIHTLVEKKQQMKETSLINKIGYLNTVTYYHIYHEPGSNYAIDANRPNDIATQTNRYIKINNFKIKLPSAMDLSNEGDDQEKSYTTDGTCIILPRTLKPYENDLFLMKYYGRWTWFCITSVEVKSAETDSGFECQFTMWNNNDDWSLPDEMIYKEENFIQELVGTEYRPIMESVDYENLRKIKDLYSTMSRTYNSLFYDKSVNIYSLKNYDKQPEIIENNININTLGRRNGLFRPTYDLENPDRSPTPVTVEEISYDDLLNQFIKEHRIFRSFDNLLITVEPLLPLDRIAFQRSIFGCIDSKNVSYFKNTSVSASKITMLQPGLPAYLIGKKIVVHHIANNTGRITAESLNPSKDDEYLSSDLIEHICTVNKTDPNLDVHCSEFVYGAGMESFFIDTIVRYICDKDFDFVDRFLYLYNNISELTEVSLRYNTIYYMFPMIAFIIEKTIEKEYQDNILLR